jgi:phosphate:Na+ symporter
MACKGWIDYPTAAAIILGENVGTTITANLAALGGNPNAKRAALAHLIFNIFGVIWAIILFQPLVNLIDALVPSNSTDPANIPIHMAAFHSAFNFINILLLIGFVPQLGKLVTRVIKDQPRIRRGSEHMPFSPAFLPQTGELNLAEAEEDVHRMSQLTRQLLTGFVELFEQPNRDLGERVKALKQLEEESDRLSVQATDYLLKCSAGRVSDASMAKITSLLRVIAELEDICDCGYRLVMLAERRYRKKRELPPETLTQVRQFSEILLRFMDFTSTCLRRPVQASDMETAYQLENFIDQFRKNLRRESMQRMRSSGDTIKAEMLYIDILNQMESIGNHSLNILQALRHHD